MDDGRPLDPLFYLLYPDALDVQGGQGELPGRVRGAVGCSTRPAVSVAATTSIAVSREIRADGGFQRNARRRDLRAGGTCA